MAQTIGQMLNQALLSHESTEWYTPSPYIEMARYVMDTIDLDPASSDIAQKIVNAEQYYTKKDDGLSQDWFGNVWLNPPYSKTAGRSNQEAWAWRLIEQYKERKVYQGILLVKSALGYKWFEEIWDQADAVCFARELIKFVKPVDTARNLRVPHPPTWLIGETPKELIKFIKFLKTKKKSDKPEPAKLGSTFFYFGPYPHRFKEEFGRIGRVYLREDRYNKFTYTETDLFLRATEWCLRQANGFNHVGEVCDLDNEVLREALKHIQKILDHKEPIRAMLSFNTEE